MTKLINLNAPVANRPAIEANLYLDMANPFVPQVKEGLVKVGVEALREEEVILDLPIQGHAATVAAFMFAGVTEALPTVAVRDPGAKFAPTGETFDLNALRQEARRERRGKKGEDLDPDKVVVVNYSHPIVPDVQTQIANAVVSDIEVRDVRVQLDLTSPLRPQFVRLVDEARIADWERAHVVINLPAFGLAAAALMAEIEGRRGHAPNTLRIGEPTRGAGFRLMEVLNLREAAEEGRRMKAATTSPMVTLSGNIPEAFRTVLAALAAAHGVAVRG